MSPESGSSSTALASHTALFAAYIAQETDRATSSHRVKLALTEAQLEEARDETIRLREKVSHLDSGYNISKLALGQEMAAAKEVEAKLSEVVKEKQAIQAELDALRTEYATKVQALEKEKQVARAAEYKAKQQTEALKVTLAEKEKLEVLLKRHALELRDEISASKEQSKVAQTLLSEEKTKIELEFAVRLETAASQTTHYRTKAEEASAQSLKSSADTRLLEVELDRSRRESNSVITALQHQVEAVSLGSSRELTHVQEQLSSLRAQHSRCPSEAEITKNEHDWNLERHTFGLQITELQEALSKADSARGEVEARFDVARETLEAQTQLVSAGLEDCQALLILVALLQKNTVHSQARSRWRMEALRSELLTAQEERDQLNESSKKHLASLALTLHHHGIASMDISSGTLQPSMMLLALWEKLVNHLPERRQSPYHFSGELTEETSPVIPAISALVDEFASSKTLQRPLVPQVSAEGKGNEELVQDPVASTAPMPSSHDRSLLEEADLEVKEGPLGATEVTSHPHPEQSVSPPTPVSSQQSIAGRGSVKLKRKRGRPKKSIQTSSESPLVPASGIAEKRRRISDQHIAASSPVLSVASSSASHSGRFSDVELVGSPDVQHTRPSKERKKRTTFRPGPVPTTRATEAAAKLVDNVSLHEMKAVTTRSGRKVQATEAVRASHEQQKPARKRLNVEDL
ncbi:hypothetical protein D9757_010927 [Collybiopsis confluens]|uniref:Uncharacterized protein n=1 Tax=Collybiopsis confluens TaxID=2823264 RepID=A0A8H5GJD0_9AGAR|nr:hypothetical protein D9757_010927 [Collybiopsis confluens]